MLTTWFSTQVLPAIISAGSGAIFGALIAGWDKLATRYMLSKLGPSIKTIYDIVDPILDANLKGWSGSDVENVIAFAIEVVHDGELSAQEINLMVKHITARFLPQVAAQKVEDGVIAERELIIAEKIKEAIESKAVNVPELIKTIRKTYFE